MALVLNLLELTGGTAGQRRGHTHNLNPAREAVARELFVEGFKLAYAVNWSSSTQSRNSESATTTAESSRAWRAPSVLFDGHSHYRPPLLALGGCHACGGRNQSAELRPDMHSLVVNVKPARAA